MIDKYYTIEEVANILKVSKMTIYRYIKKHKIIALKLGKEYRISETDLKHFLDSNKTKNG